MLDHLDHHAVPYSDLGLGNPWLNSDCAMDGDRNEGERRLVVGCSAAYRAKILAAS